MNRRRRWYIFGAIVFSPVCFYLLLLVRQSIYLEFIGPPKQLFWDFSTSRDSSAVNWPPDDNFIWCTEDHRDIDIVVPGGRRVHFADVEGELIRADNQVSGVIIRFQLESLDASYAHATSLMKEWGLDSQADLAAWYKHIKSASLSSLGQMGHDERDFTSDKRSFRVIPRFVVEVHTLASYPKPQWLVEWEFLMAPSGS